MPKTPDFILQISIRNIEDFSPGAIIRSPRTFRPIDVQNACANTALEPSKDTPAIVTTLARYIALEFFAHSHGTGLYNRQIKLWEGLARTQSVEVNQARKGWFSQKKTPEFDFAFLDHKKRAQILAHYAMPEENGANFDYLNSCREFLKRAAAASGICGLFLCYPSPFPAKVLEFIRKETNASDNIARFESVLPKFGVAVNLIEVERSPVYNPKRKSEEQKMRLIYPDLTKKKLGATALPGAELRQLDNYISPDAHPTVAQQAASEEHSDNSSGSSGVPPAS